MSRGQAVNVNLLKFIETEDLSALQIWIRERFCSENGLEICASFEESMYNNDIDMLDVRFALKNCEAVSNEYGLGCCVIHGPTIDGDGISVAVVIKVSKERLKLIKVWRE